jgi:hypothetical protein
MPLSTVRWSRAGRPRGGRWAGRSGRRRAHCSPVSSSRWHAQQCTDGVTSVAPAAGHAAAYGGPRRPTAVYGSSPSPSCDGAAGRPCSAPLAGGAPSSMLARRAHIPRSVRRISASTSRCSRAACWIAASSCRTAAATSAAARTSESAPRAVRSTVVPRARLRRRPPQLLGGRAQRLLLGAELLMRAAEHLGVVTRGLCHLAQDLGRLTGLLEALAQDVGTRPDLLRDLTALLRAFAAPFSMGAIVLGGIASLLRRPACCLRAAPRRLGLVRAGVRCLSWIVHGVLSPGVGRSRSCALREQFGRHVPRQTSWPPRSVQRTLRAAALCTRALSTASGVPRDVCSGGE